MLTIVAFWIIFHKLHRQTPVCSLEKRQNFLLLNHKAWMQYLFSLPFCIPGVKGNSSILCWIVQDVCLLRSDEKVIFQKPVLTYSIFLVFLMLKEYALFWRIKQIFWFLLSYSSLICNLVRIPWTNQVFITFFFFYLKLLFRVLSITEKYVMAMTTNTLVSEFYYRISVLNMHFISFSSTRSVVIPSLFSRKYYITNQNKSVH